MVDVKKNRQREYTVNQNTGKLMEAKKDDEEDLPPRGTGRRTGTARTPPGTGEPLTEEERKKRHEEKTK